MRFSFAMLYALVATAPVVTANPAPAWNGKGAEAGYKVGAVACGVGAYICNSYGQSVAAATLASGTFCCSSAAAAVTASQSEGWRKAWRKAADGLGAAAQVVKGGGSKVGKFVAKCTATACQMVKKEPTLPRRSLRRSGMSKRQLASRLRQLARDIQRDEALVTRSNHASKSQLLSRREYE